MLIIFQNGRAQAFHPHQGVSFVAKFRFVLSYHIIPFCHIAWSQ